MEISQFNIRVYFLLLDEKQERVLLSDEMIKGKPFTKFPGGGLEFGEGPEDCAKREAIEELGQEIEILSHFYTTGFFQQSLFRKSDQIISIYYTAKLIQSAYFAISNDRFNFNSAINQDQIFRWCKIEELNMEEFELPIDKIIVKMLLSKGV